MKTINQLLSEVGVSKVKLAKYLGVSRQMLYNYLANDNIDEWPKEKAIKLMNLFGLSHTKTIDDIVIDNEYILTIDSKIVEGVKDANDHTLSDLRGFNRKEQELIGNIFNLLREELFEDKTKDTYNTYVYLYNFLQSMENTKELKYILAYMSKAMGFTDPMEFAFNKDQQFIFESILFSAMTLYTGGGASKTKLAESHNRFVQDIEHKNEEKLSRTQELNTAKVQALKELGYTEINENNAKEVLEKIAEIQSRKV